MERGAAGSYRFTPRTCFTLPGNVRDCLAYVEEVVQRHTRKLTQLEETEEKAEGVNTKNHPSGASRDRLTEMGVFAPPPLGMV